MAKHTVLGAKKKLIKTYIAKKDKKMKRKTMWVKNAFEVILES